jgi:hypothetical protein
MNVKRLIRSGWFWAAALLLAVTLAVFGYTLFLRSAVEQLVQEQLQAAHRFVGILEAVRGPDDLDSAWHKILEQQDLGKVLAARAQALPQPSDQFRKELSERYGPEMKAVYERFVAEKKRISNDVPGGKEFCDNLEKLSRGPEWSLGHLGTTS